MQIFYDKKGMMQTAVLVAILFTFAAGVGLFFYFSKMPNGKQKPQTNNVPVQLTNNNIQNQNNNVAEPVIPPAPENNALRDGCLNLPSNIESCTPYKCLYTYNKAGVDLTNEVFGMVDGKCKYTEQTRNVGTTLNCNFTDETRQSIVKFYRDLKLYDSENTTGEPAASYEFYKVGEKEVQDPLLESVLNGECQADK